MGIPMLPVLVVLTGLACLLSGVFLLLGVAWALIVAGVLLIPVGLFVVPVREREESQATRIDRPIHGVVA